MSNITNLRVFGGVDVRLMGTDQWRLLSPIRAEYQYDGLVREVEAYSGFSHDFASIPGPIRRIPVVGRFFRKIDMETARASIIHDLLYVEEPVWCTRKEADDLFYAIMREDEASWFKAQAMHKAVRAFGGLLWDGEPFGKSNGD